MEISIYSPLLNLERNIQDKISIVVKCRRFVLLNALRSSILPTVSS